MNHVPTTSHYDLLARTWRCPAPVTALAFAGDGSAVAFALADGTVAITATADEEAPDRRIRVSADIGRATIRPRRDPLPPLTLVPGDGSAPLIAPGAGAEFLLGTAAGAVLTLSATGIAGETALAFDRPVTALDRNGATGTVAASDGETLLFSDDPRDPGAIRGAAGSAIGCLALSPDGGLVAIAEDRALTVSDLAGAAPFVVTLPARPTAIAWRGDGRWIAAPMIEGGFALIDLAGRTSSVVGGFPAPVQTVAFSGPAKALVASGAFRVAGWSMETPPVGDARQGALETGRRGFVAVDRVAAHPKRKLVAAAYENGQILVAQIGKPDELIVRPAGASVTAMEWSADGRELAFGASDGTAALIGFPPQMFK
ncbi:WD40 repeat domain-containing protein [Segnochrobactrum spirostomi]|uniref:WD40 repeat domain-containing protein n=1 Tax=Segnochrobactrum spirostomi TaxID=2608987 RepID=A0A6A7Y8X6_9HYPH|nr:hypothetical protein [Segnochrobactrum spirostomi]MQT14807.1 hypothetical protein [Segnochrobactrum spirostomi]